MGRASYELMANVDADAGDVEAAQGSSTNDVNIPEGSRPDGQVEVIPYMPKPGIAMPPRKRCRCLLMIRWVIALACFNLFVWYVLHTMTTQSIWKIPSSVDTLSMDLEHCNLQFIAPDDDDNAVEPMLTIQHWNFLGGSSVVHRGSTTHVALHMSMLNPMFRCLVTVLNPPQRKLKNAHIRLEGHAMSRISVQSAPSEVLELRMPDAVFEATELPALLNITVLHGVVRLRIPEDTPESTVEVSSASASLYVVSEPAIDVHTSASGKNYSMFAAPSVTSLDHGGVRLGGGPGQIAAERKYLVLPDAAAHDRAGGPAEGEAFIDRRLAEDPKVRIKWGSSFNGPGYFMVLGEPGAELQKAFGDGQNLEKAILTQESVHELEALGDWMRAVRTTARPWVAKLRLRNPGLRCGSFQLVSSEAYLVVKLEWLALISATLLHPELKELTLQAVSLRTQWPPSDPQAVTSGGCVMGAPSGVRDPEMMELFRTVSQYFDPPEGSTLAWVPDGHYETPIIFLKRGPVWHTIYHKVTSGQSLLFLCALALNLTASTITATVALFLLTTRGRDWLMGRIRRDTITVAASQRITQRTTAQTWRLNATLVDSPHGVLLRWTKRTGEQRPTYLWITAEAGEDPLRGLAYDEVCVERVLNERVPSMRENSSISEFFFSVEQFCPESVYDPSQRNKELQHLFCYRFQVQACDHNEDIMLTSEWSNEVFITPRWGIFDLPLLMVKQLCPVPTASLGYFLDQFADRHINGKTPQQILVLSDIRLTFHRNFRDLQDCDEKFYLTVFAGASRDDCEKETYVGRVRTFDRTWSFTPPKTALEQNPEDPDDEARTITLRAYDGGTKLKLGRVNEDVKQVTFRLHWASSGDDIAEGRHDYSDFTWEFEQAEETADSTEEAKPPQTVEVDLAADREVFDEDYLVYLRARVSFQNSIDSKCKELEQDQRFFTEDAPGQVFYKGMERFVTWDADSKLVESESFDLFIEFPDAYTRDAEDIRSVSSNPRLLSENVARASVGLTIMVDFPDVLTSQNCIAAQLYAQDKDGNQARSHRFLICQTWLLSDMEHMYASFCKMNGVSMQQLNKDAREEFGITTMNAQLKVLPNLRKPLPFEHQEPLYESPGTCMISSSNITARHLEDISGKKPDDGDEERSQAGKTTASKESKRREMGREDKIFVVTSQRVEILHSMWPRQFRFESLQWVPALLLTYDFYPVDNIVNFLTSLCMVTHVNTLFGVMQYILGASLADRLLHVLLAPLFYLLPYIAESLLYLWQFCCFMALPLIPLVAAGMLEFLSYEMNASIGAVATTSTIEENLPDALFSSTLSGYGLSKWLDGMATASKLALFTSCGMYVVLLGFIFETNFVRDAWPSSMQGVARKFFNDTGKTFVFAFVWLVSASFIMAALWFVMAVVIYPEQMMAVLAGVGGMGAVAFTMAMRYRATKEQIMMFLKDEVPEILDLVCDNFLQRFDREDLGGASQQRSIRSEKLMEIAYREMRLYMEQRFKSHEVAELAMKIGTDNKKLFQQVFDRALLKHEHWNFLDNYSSPRFGSSPAAERPEVKTTEHILNEGGLTQEDTSAIDHFAMRIRISDRETELQDKSVHQYSEDLRQKLMSVYVRCLESVAVQPDVAAILDDPKKLGKAIHRAQKAKIELFDDSKYEGEGSMMQLFISDVNQRELKKYELIIAAYLDDKLDTAQLAEAMTTFIWREIPADIKKELRLTLDEQCVGSAMHKVLENLRRWKNSHITDGGDAALRAGLTLGPCPMTSGSEEPEGLLKMLMDIKVADPNSSVDYLQVLWRHLEGKVREWRDEEERDLTVNANDLEDFVRELLNGKVWWGALTALLTNVGFPFVPQEGASRANLLPLSQVRTEFETFVPVWKNGGFMPKERIPDFLCTITRANSADGGCGRIWKAQMIKLMQKVEICGFVNLIEGGRVKKKKNRATVEPIKRGEGLSEFAGYIWPRWLMNAWLAKSPEWKGKDGSSLGGQMKPFMSKSDIYAFLQDIAYMPATAAREVSGHTKIDEDYSNWLKDKDEGGNTLGIWSKNGKATLELRGIWQECFMKILADMSNEVSDREKGLMLFDLCLEEQKKTRSYTDSHREGLLNISFLVAWLRRNLVADTAEVSLQVFQKVLARCELTLPKIVVTSLWHSAKPTERFNGNWALRKVRDLEDRIVMYLVKGIPAESVEALIFDVLPVPSLQDISHLELRTMFKQVDTKLGTNGFLEPREVKALMRNLAQAGMTLSDLLVSLKKLGMDFPESDVKEAFLVLDTSADDMMDLPEFLGMVDFIIMRLIPQEILRVMGLQPQQVVLRLLFAIFTLVAIFLFIFVSLGAFHVSMPISQAGAGGGASMVRVGLTLLAVVALKRETSEEDEERFFKNARDRLYAMMGVTYSQIDARRRAMGIAARPLPTLKRSPEFKFGGGVKKKRGGGDDDDDDDDGVDDD